MNHRIVTKGLAAARAAAPSTRKPTSGNRRMAEITAKAKMGSISSNARKPFYKGRPTLPHFTALEAELLAGAGFKVDKDAGTANLSDIVIRRDVSKVDGKATYFLEDKDILEVYRDFGRCLFAAGTLLAS